MSINLRLTSEEFNQSDGTQQELKTKISSKRISRMPYCDKQIHKAKASEHVHALFDD